MNKLSRSLMVEEDLVEEEDEIPIEVVAEDDRVRNLSIKSILNAINVTN
jgi:hypothetical protein